MALGDWPKILMTDGVKLQKNSIHCGLLDFWSHKLLGHNGIDTPVVTFVAKSVLLGYGYRLFRNCFFGNKDDSR